jgi:hypothetical protein
MAEHSQDDLFDLDDLNDEELKGLVRRELDEYDTIDSDNILVQAKDGVVTLSGRIGTEAERRIAEHIVSDVIGLRDYRMELLVDPVRRDIEPEAIDDHLATMDPGEEDQLGGRDDLNSEPSAEHLREDLDGRLYGTHDVQRSIADGMSWNPPDTPTPEGLGGSDAEPGDMSEDH